MRSPAVSLILAALCLFAVTAQAGSFTREMTIPANALKVADLLGAVRVTASPDAAFHVRVDVKGDDASPDAIKVEQDDGAVRVVFPVEQQRRYIYPDLCCKKTSFHRGMAQENDSWWQRILDTAGGKRIKVYRKGRGFQAWADMAVQVPENARLEIAHGAGPVTVDGVQARITCELRRGPVQVTALRGAFHGGSESGKVTCRNVTGDLHLEVGSGDIIVRDSRGKHLHADTGSGEVTLKNVVVSLLEVDTGSGGVTGKEIGADEARVETGSGDITLAFARLGNDWFRLETGSGDIDVTLPRDASVTVTAGTGSGKITHDLPEAAVEASEDGSVRLVLGEGEARLKAEAGSGDIRLHY